MDQLMLSRVHPAVRDIAKFFEYDHLPPHLSPISAACHDLAEKMIAELPGGGAELTAGLRKLLEAKDCFVRAALP